MLSPSLKTMLAALGQASDPKAQEAELKHFGRTLLERPKDAAELLAQMAGSAAAAGATRMSQLLNTGLGWRRRTGSGAARLLVEPSRNGCRGDLRLPCQSYAGISMR